MFDVSPGWHTTIHPFYVIATQLLSYLALLILITLIGIKLFTIKKEQYQRPLNIINLMFCVLSTTLLLAYFVELIVAWYAGYFYEQLAFFDRAIGPIWKLYFAVMILSLLLTQLLWRKKNRININLALFIILMYHIQLWFERIYIFLSTYIR